MKLEILIQIIASGITIAGIWVGYRSSYKQIKESNKQALFEKRLKIYMISEGLYKLVTETTNMLDIPSEVDIDNAIHFHNMINNSQLNHLASVIPEPINAKGLSPIKLPDAQRDFLTKKEEMLQQAQAAELIFEEPINFIVSNFISDYILLLDGRRRYEIFLKMGMEKYDILCLTHKNLELNDYLEEKLDEKKYRKQLLIDPINKLNVSFEDYQRQKVKIKEQMALTK